MCVLYLLARQVGITVGDSGLLLLCLCDVLQAIIISFCLLLL